eukprot:10413655-Karenia_brevis.AAC.1
MMQQRRFPDAHVDPSVFMSVSDLSRRFAKLKPKGIGENRLGGELYSVCPQTFARLYHPLATKIISSCTPPVQWVGGQAMDYYK